MCTAGAHKRIQKMPGECWVVKDPKMANSGYGVVGSLDEIPTQLTGICGGQDSRKKAIYSEHPYWSLCGHISSLCFWDERQNPCNDKSQLEELLPPLLVAAGHCSPWALISCLLNRSISKLHGNQGRTPNPRTTGRMEFNAAKPSTGTQAKIKPGKEVMSFWCQGA